MFRKGQHAALIAIVVALAVFVAPVATSATDRTTDAGQAHLTLSTLESGVLTQLNAIRAQHGLTPLKLSSALTASATAHTREMGADGYFQHPSFDGTAFWKRIDAYYPSKGYSYWSVGENLLWSSPDVDPASAMTLWMNSPEHRANILDPTWREIGISALHLDSAPGTYDNLPVTIITTDFGVRR